VLHCQSLWCKVVVPSASLYTSGVRLALVLCCYLAADPFRFPSSPLLFFLSFSVSILLFLSHVLTHFVPFSTNRRPQEDP